MSESVNFFHGGQMENSDYVFPRSAHKLITKKLHVKELRYRPKINRNMSVCKYL